MDLNPSLCLILVDFNLFKTTGSKWFSIIWIKTPVLYFFALNYFRLESHLFLFIVLLFRIALITAFFGLGCRKFHFLDHFSFFRRLCYWFLRFVDCLIFRFDLFCFFLFELIFDLFCSNFIIGLLLDFIWLLLIFEVHFNFLRECFYFFQLNFKIFIILIIIY